MPAIGLETTGPKNITSGNPLICIHGMMIKYKIRYYIKPHIHTYIYVI